MEPTTERTTNPEITVAHRLDCSGLLCPLPVYKASIVLKGLAPGQTLELICTDPGSLEDIPALARQGGHELLRTVTGDDTQTFWLRKAAGR